MKKIRITLRKEKARATCLHHYRIVQWPDKSEWSGDRAAFRYHGRDLDFSGTLDYLERNVAHQARLVGAEYEIEDLGGEVVRWIDEVEM